MQQIVEDATGAADLTGQCLRGKEFQFHAVNRGVAVLLLNGRKVEVVDQQHNGLGRVDSEGSAEGCDERKKFAHGGYSKSNRVSYPDTT